ncbi:hypothetical protein SAMN05443377_11179 [Propionibacterium cyclohexanicum]|uniref:Uncharacterized protein n=1 Tax=Propionibacterium cyclohexanicum TaxID=64702 RepID=A0A1H9S7E6_9ACTN|nr:hypothetical protein SAMN05443377_11179 [Propionibacterium cyclohexanicum]
MTMRAAMSIGVLRGARRLGEAGAMPVPNATRQAAGRGRAATIAANGPGAARSQHGERMPLADAGGAAATSGGRRPAAEMSAGSVRPPRAGRIVRARTVVRARTARTGATGTARTGATATAMTGATTPAPSAGTEVVRTMRAAAHRVIASMLATAARGIEGPGRVAEPVRARTVPPMTVPAPVVPVRNAARGEAVWNEAPGVPAP